MNDADRNGVIDITEVVGVKVLEEGQTIGDHKLPGAFTRKAVLPFLEKYTFIIFYDKHGNGYSRIIY